MKRESVLAIIGARGGSKGVNNKNIRPLLGKPLIAWTIEQATASLLFDHIVLTSDSEEIMRISAEYGADVFFKRPDEYATDTAPKIPAIRHALVESEKHFGKQYDCIVDLDATAPLRIVQDLIDALQQFEREGYEALITAMPARRSPYFNLIEQDAHGRVALSKKLDRPIVRRQDSPKCFDMNASFDIWKREALLNNNTLFTGNTGLYVMPEERSIDIDSELDWRMVEMLMAERTEEQVK
ncbi:MAG: flagellar modification protein B [Comamonadaceae bacterium CG1_02_60_18]|nr:MAG: flagellar modification protein B [Comamonadaceae bacterium CG1_02_60_18]PIQ55538.1 MAG: flagellar modification protein B [Comamonadaceae bacterium CG12_big_fil_rev_8_21_14_0_65_59_15]